MRSLHHIYCNCKFTARYHILILRYENMKEKLYPKPRLQWIVSYREYSLMIKTINQRKRRFKKSPKMKQRHSSTV